MPRYNYYCEECDSYYELEHSMVSVVEDCIACESPQFARVPSIPAYMQKARIEQEFSTGDMVEEYIKKNKKSIQEQKSELKEKLYSKE